MATLVDSGAREVLDVVPLVMRTIRKKFREQRTADLSLAQFRALTYINRQDGTSLSDVAEHLGLGLPSASKLVDGLVGRKLIVRISDKGDRRRVCLSITPKGKEKVDLAHAHTQAFLADKMRGLSDDELETVTRAMRILRGLFVVLAEPSFSTEQ